jgi:uncharacterized membrane protein
MKFTFKTEIIPLLLILISVVLGFYFYAVFPDQVPMHWNAYGEVDRYGSKLEGAIIGPAVLLGLYILFLVIPLLDPKKEKYEQFVKVYQIFRLMIMIVLFGVFLIASLNGIGYNIRVEIWIPFFIGWMFIFMGNYFGKIKPNWFMGIRTPWTLSSDEVWYKTHRLGGKMFMLLGLFFVLTPLWPVSSLLWTLIVPAVLAALVPMVYSYVIYKKLKK